MEQFKPVSRSAESIIYLKEKGMALLKAQSRGMAAVKDLLRALHSKIAMSIQKMKAKGKVSKKKVLDSFGADENSPLPKQQQKPDAPVGPSCDCGRPTLPGSHQCYPCAHRS